MSPSRRSAGAGGGRLSERLAPATLTLLTRSSASVQTERDTALPADVRNATGDQLFDNPPRLALAVNLEQAPFLRILPRAAVRAALVRAGLSPPCEPARVSCHPRGAAAVDPVSGEVLKVDVTLNVMK